MLKLTATWFRSLGFLPISLTPQQILLRRQYALAMRIRAIRINDLYDGTGYRVPFEGW